MLSPFNASDDIKIRAILLAVLAMCGTDESAFGNLLDNVALKDTTLFKCASLQLRYVARCSRGILDRKLIASLKYLSVPVTTHDKEKKKKLNKRPERQSEFDVSRWVPLIKA